VFVCKNARNLYVLASTVHDWPPGRKVAHQSACDPLHVQRTQLCWLCGVATDCERHVLTRVEHWLPAFDERGVLWSQLGVVGKVRLSGVDVLNHPRARACAPSEDLPRQAEVVESGGGCGGLA